MRNYFILDGVDSRDFGVYISGQGTFNASGRDYNIIPVPGRNGDLVGPEKRFANGTLTYPAFIYSNFKTNIEAFRNFLLSLVGYHDLVDSYHPDQIRKVLFQGPFNADVQTKNDAGRFDIEFICKPQRFLASGNEVTTFESSGGDPETYNGKVITYSNPGDAIVNALSTTIIAVQDGAGDPSPSNVRPITGWTGAKFYRTGINLLGGEAFSDAILETMPTATVDTENGTVTFAGNTVDNNTKIISGGVKFKENTQYTFIFSFTGERRNVRWWYTDGTFDSSSDVPTSGVYRSASGKTVASLRKIRYNNTPVTLNYNSCGIFEGKVTAADFEAYNGAVYSVSFGTTVYGGTFDAANGTLTVTHGEIASYAGETLPGAWISDRDVYAPGTTPTTGAQVVYELATPTIIPLTPPSVTLLSDINNVWNNVNDTTLTIAFPQDQFTITNPTLFDSQPFLRVYGTGTLGVNSQSVTITQADGYTDIDCEMMDCYKGTTNKNPYVQFTDYNFPVLKPGVNYVSLSGITKVEITPRWWIV